MSPKRVTLSTELFESVMGILDQLPYGQVYQLMDAIRSDVKPLAEGLVGDGPGPEGTLIGGFISETQEGPRLVAEEQ